MSLALAALETLISGFRITSTLIKREFTLLSLKPVESIKVYLEELANTRNIGMVLELDFEQQKSLALVLAHLYEHKLINPESFDYLCTLGTLGTFGTQDESFAYLSELSNLARIISLIAGYDLGCTDFYRRLLIPDINLRSIYDRLFYTAESRGLNDAIINAILPSLESPRPAPPAPPPVIAPAASEDVARPMAPQPPPALTPRGRSVPPDLSIATDPRGSAFPFADEFVVISTPNALNP